MTGIFAPLARLGRLRARIVAGLALAMACLLVAPPAAAQTNTRVTRAAPAKAVVLTPLSLVKTADLNFGRIAARPVAGTVTIASDVDACTYAVVSGIGPCTDARFSGRGVMGGGVRIGLVSSTNLTGPGQTMVLDTLTVSGLNGALFVGNGNSNGRGLGLIQGNGNNNRFRISGVGGVFDFGIGGTLHVNANQTPGIYRGTVTVTVTYN
jgi:spore coat protein U-like protein